MKKLTIPVAGLVSAVMLGSSSAAYADPPIFNMVPADPPLVGKVDCTAEGLGTKNIGMTLTFIKSWTALGFDVTEGMQDQAEFFGLDNAGEFMKVIALPGCNIGPN